VGQQPFVRQQPEGFAQSVAGHGKRATNGVFGEPGAWREEALADARAQHVSHSFGRARPAEQNTIGDQP
jgi:hypothetical protein